MKEIIYIVSILLIQAGYDFVFWRLILKESCKWYIEWVYRINKFVLDYPLSIYVIFWCFPNKYLYAFYWAKQWGICDYIYKLIQENIFHQIWHDGEIDWLWWTPMGWCETIMESWQAKKFIKGHVSVKEFNWEAGIAIVGFILIILIF